VLGLVERKKSSRREKDTASLGSSKRAKKKIRGKSERSGFKKGRDPSSASGLNLPISKGVLKGGKESVDRKIMEILYGGKRPHGERACALLLKKKLWGGDWGEIGKKNLIWHFPALFSFGYTNKRPGAKGTLESLLGV